MSRQASETLKRASATIAGVIERMEWVPRVVGHDGADACAEYILRELDWYAGLAGADGECTPPAP